MTLTLRAVSLNDQPLTRPITAHFDAQGGSIGRSDQNTLALPDPERHISRQQAAIVAAGTGYAIRNTGSANPIVVRGQTLMQGESALLRHRDQVRIGGYLLEVVAQQDDEASTVTRGRAHVDARTPGSPRTGAPLPGVAGLADFNTPLSNSNPFADLMGGGSPTPTPTPMHVAKAIPGPAAVSLPPPAPPVPSLPTDFDPFGLPPKAPAAPAAAPPAASSPAVGIFDDLIPREADGSIDDLFALPAGDSRDPLADFLKGATPAAGAGPAAASTDPFAMFGDKPPPAPPAPEPADHVPALRGAYRPPAVAAAADVMLPTGIDWLASAPVAKPPPVEPRPEPAVEAPAAAPAPRVADDAAPPAVEADALWAAFRDGAGIDVTLPQGLTPETMRVIGSVLRSAVDGTLKLVALRAATKHELHEPVTVIRARRNNPMKFSPDAQVALEQLLKPPVRGFLAGPDAMEETMDDLVGHAIGTMAGTRAAIAGVLDRFAPAELEGKLAARSMLDSVLPMNRKAKLWELYLQHFELIRAEAQEDFQTLFGKAFVAAYEQQLERLKRDKTKD